MIRFAANLGFLWNDRALPDAIHAAAVARFDAVECHMPYAHDPPDVAAALEQTGLPMLGLNTDHSGPEVGVGAIPGREAEARSDIERAVDYALAIDCPAIHVMAGCTGRAPGAEEATVEELVPGSERVAEVEIGDQTWTRWSSPDDETTYSRVVPGPREDTTAVVTSDVDRTTLERYVASLS